MADVHLCRRFVKHEVRVFFVHCVVCQVHEPVIQIFGPGGFVGLGGKSGQSFLKDENSEGVDARHKHIDPQVKFKAINQVGFMHVTLHYAFIML